MSRIKRGFVSRKRHKKIIKLNKGYRGSHSRLFKVANQENIKSLVYSYHDRKKKKRNMRSIWIKQINGLLRFQSKLKYSETIKKLKEKKIILNRKIIAKICLNDRNTFKKILEI